MKCVKCDAQLLDGTDFCPYCGTENFDNSRIKNKFCPNCRKMVLSNIEVCECGYKFIEVIQPKAKEAPKDEAGCWAAFAKVSNILGTISLCIFWIPIFGIMAILPGSPGIVFGILGKRSKKENVIDRASSGFLKSLLGTVFGFLGYCLLMIILISSGN